MPALSLQLRLKMEENVQNSAAIAQRHYDCFNDRDLSLSSVLITDQTEWTNVPLNRPFRGKEGYWEHIQKWVSAFSDMKLETLHRFAGDDFVVTELMARGTHDGPLSTPAGEIPPSGRSLRLPMCEVLLIRAGKIAAARLYFDSAQLLQQIGVRTDRLAA